MSRTTKLGGSAALIQVVITILNFLFGVVILPLLGFRGMADLTDPALAVSLKTPLLALELLKLASALAITLTVLGVGSLLRVHAPTLITVATGFGLIGTLLLALGGLIGIGTLNSSSASAASLTSLINTLGTASISLIGVWIIIANGTARRFKLWPGGWCIFGIVLGVVSLPVPLLPPLALLPLFLGLGWWPWLGVTLLREA